MSAELLEAERWDRMLKLHEDYERLRAEAKTRKLELKDDSGTAAALLRVFGPRGSLDNAWWTTWRPA